MPSETEDNAPALKERLEAIETELLYLGCLLRGLNVLQDNQPVPDRLLLHEQARYARDAMEPMIRILIQKSDDIYDSVHEAGKRAKAA